MSDAETAQPYPTLAVIDYGGTPNRDPPLQLGKPPPATKTYLFQLFPQLLGGGEGMSMMVVEGTLPDEKSDDIVAALRKLNHSNYSHSPLTRQATNPTAVSSWRATTRRSQSTS
jgi:hypothetical protein